VEAAKDTEVPEKAEKAKTNEKTEVPENAEEEKEEAPKAMNSKEKDKQIKKIEKLKQQLDKDLAPLLGAGDSKVGVTESPEKSEKKQKEEKGEDKSEEKSEDVRKGKDDLGDFEERTAKKGDADQFVDPFKRKAAAAPDVDGEISEEQKAKESQYRVKVDDSGEPVEKEATPAVQDKAAKGGAKKAKKKAKAADEAGAEVEKKSAVKKKKGTKPKEVTGKEGKET